MTAIYGESPYYVPVLDIQLDSPVLDIKGDEANSLVSEMDILAFNIVLQVHHTGDNDVNPKRLASIHPIPYPLVDDDTRQLLSKLLAPGVFLSGINLYQFVKANIILESLVIPYYLFHVMKEIACLDTNNTQSESFDDGQIFAIDKLVIDYDKLLAVPKEERLIFRLEELNNIYLFEQQLVEKLVNNGMQNIIFVAAEQWNSDIEFSI